MAIKYLSGNRVTALSTDLVSETTTELGYTGSSQGHINSIHYKRFSATAGQKITKIGVRVYSCSDTKFKGGVYTDNGASDGSGQTGTARPQTLLSQGEITGVSTSNANLWVEVDVDCTVPSDGLFWVGFISDDNSTNWYRDSSNSLASGGVYGSDCTPSGRWSNYANMMYSTANYGNGNNNQVSGNNVNMRYTISSPRLGTSGAPDGIGSAGDLTLSGTTSYNTGLVGKCLYADFSGTEGQQGTPAGNFFGQARTNNDDFNFIHTNGEAWTINLWVKPTVAENGAIQQLIGNESYNGSSLSGFNIKILDRSASSEVRRVSTDFKNDGNVIYSAYNGTDGDMPNNTNWAMITVRCNGATTSGATALNININGGTSNNDFSTPNGTCTRSSSTATARNATYGLMFGRNLYKAWGSANSNADPFDGSFDEVSIWNRELTDAECVALYNSGSGAVTTTAVTNHSGLKAYWNFNDTVENQAKITNITVTVPNGSVAEETNTGIHRIWSGSAWTKVA